MTPNIFRSRLIFLLVVGVSRTTVASPHVFIVRPIVLLALASQRLQVASSFSSFFAGSQNAVLPRKQQNSFAETRLCNPPSNNQVDLVSRRCSNTAVRMGLGINDDDEVARQLARAKELLAKSQEALDSKKLQNGAKAKLDEKAVVTQEEDNVDSDEVQGETTATKTKVTATNKRDIVTKTVQENTGLITTDGEMMAKLSESEEWEARRLLEIFDGDGEEDGTFVDEDDDLRKTRFFFANYEDKKQKALQRLRQFGSTSSLADKDVAANIQGLRKSMQNADFEAVFDKRNRFIGES